MKRFGRSMVLATAITAMLASGVALAEDWPQFRGPNQDGTLTADEIVLTADGAVASKATRQNRTVSPVSEPRFGICTAAVAWPWASRFPCPTSPGTGVIMSPCFGTLPMAASSKAGKKL